MSLFDELKAPFPPDRISWRVGSTTGDKKKGMALAFIDARDVMERLDEVVGPQNWQNTYPHANDKTVCSIGIKIDGEWVWKSDGAGDTEYEAEKGALSDSFKRAAVRWGIGRYLYDVAAPWVEIEPMGKSFKIKESEYAKLARILGGNARPAQASAPSQTGAMAEPQATKAADELIQNIGGCVTVAELESYKSGPAFKGIYLQLPKEHRDRVVDAGRQRMTALKDKAA